MTYPDTRVYEGQWCQNKREGQGIITYPTNQKLTGEFKNNMPNGDATFVGPGIDVRRRYKIKLL